MIELPWQLAAVGVLCPTIVVVALVMQLRDRADRQAQRDGHISRQQRDAIHSGLMEGHQIYLEMRERQQEVIDNELTQIIGRSFSDRPGDGST